MLCYRRIDRIRSAIYDTQCGATTSSRHPRITIHSRFPFQSRWIFDVEIILAVFRRALPSLTVSLGKVTNTAGVPTATATVTTVEHGIQGVVFAVDGHYSKRGAVQAEFWRWRPSGTHTVTATVVDAVGVPAVSGKQSVSTTGNVGPTGPLRPNVDPAQPGFDTAGNANDPINGQP